jgi:uncharacterized phage protein gp47/JayE
MSEYVTPDFLKNRSTEDNFKKITAILPQNIDLSAGNHAWNMTRPTALAMAEICEAILPRVLHQIIPGWSYGTYLDGHAKSRNMSRRPATAATGEITITGKAGLVIPTGSLFSTAAVNDEPSVDYATEASATIPAEGSVTIPVECTQLGIVGNTPANTVVLLSSKLTGITSITNADAITGGTEEETDESLQARIDEADQSQGNSYTGCPADYKHWATSVAGVGEATIIPAQDDSGLVRIVLTDANGDPATTNLCDAVYNYIMKPDEPDKRLAPIGALLSVNPPDTIQISIKATVELKDTATIEGVKTAYAASLAAYLPEAFSDGEIKYFRVWACLASTAGVNDFTALQIGVKNGDSVTYGNANISVSEAQLPTVAEEDLVLTAGTV